MDTEQKLKTLTDLYRECEYDVLLELLVSCDGSVEKVKSILGSPVQEGGKYELGSVKHGVRSRYFPMKNMVRVTGAKTSNTTEIGNLKARETNTKNHTTSGTVSSVQAYFQKATPKPTTLHKRPNPTSISSIIQSRTKREVDYLEEIREPPRKALKPLSTGKTITLYSKEQVEEILPNIRIFSNFLPQDLSEQVVDLLQSQRMLFRSKEFYIAGRLCTSSQNSLVYTDNDDIDYDPVYSTKNFKSVKVAPAIRRSQAYVNEKVNKVLKEIYADDENAPDYMIKENWTSNFCVANYYPNNKSHLDMHTDKLTNIGPLPTIASLTFGATRLFRLKRSNPSTSTIYQIPIHNNTLLIMLPSTQELYKHGIPTLSDSLIKKDKVLGTARFNLTFRMAYPELQKQHVLCDKCKRRMILRRLYKGEDIGYYIWMCMSSFKGHSCNGFKYANFSRRDGVLRLSTMHKNEATRWLDEYERKDINAST